jgi:hypothetical protein
MKTRLAIVVLVAGVLGFGLISLQAQTEPAFQADERLAYSGWCRYMEGLQAERSLLGWRSLLDTGGVLVGSIVCLIEMLQPTPNLKRAVLSAAMCSVGVIDLFAFTIPRHEEVAFRMRLFRRIGADRMWVWPCSDPEPSE